MGYAVRPHGQPPALRSDADARPGARTGGGPGDGEAARTPRHRRAQITDRHPVAEIDGVADRARRGHAHRAPGKRERVDPVDAVGESYRQPSTEWLATQGAAQR